MGVSVSIVSMKKNTMEKVVMDFGQELVAIYLHLLGRGIAV